MQCVMRSGGKGLKMQVIESGSVPSLFGSGWPGSDRLGIILVEGVQCSAEIGAAGDGCWPQQRGHWARPCEPAAARWDNPVGSQGTLGSLARD